MRFHSEFVVAVLSLVCFAVGCSPKGNTPSNTTRRVDTALAPIFEARNLGLAYLENDEQQKAFAPLKTVLTGVPSDPFGPQNLAVAGVMALDKLNADRDASAITEANAATSSGLTALAAIEPESAVLSFLRGRLSLFNDEPKTGYDFFLKAAHRAQDAGNRTYAAAFWYAAYEASIEYRLAEDDAERLALLQTAYELQPENLFLLSELLKVAAAQEDASLGQLIDATARLVEPLRPGIIKRSGERYDPIVFLDRAKKLVAAGNAKATAPLLNGLAQILRSQPLVRGDLALLKPNLLEFARLDFESSFYARFPKATAISPQSIAFDSVWPERFQTLETNGKVHALVGGDTNLDGIYEAYGVAVNETENVTSLALVGVLPSGVDQLTIGPIEGRFENALFADLDNDFDNNPAAIVNEGAGESPCRTTDLDVVFYGESGVRVLRNEIVEGERTFQAIDESGLANLADVTAATVFDADADADLDLVIATPAEGIIIFLNRGDGTFERSDGMMAGAESIGEIQKLIAIDIDRDVDIDVLALGTSDPPVVVLENLRHREFRARAVEHVLGPGVRPTDLVVMDVDENRSWDLLLTTESSGTLLRSTTAAPGLWRINDVADVRVSGALTAADFDNDGRTDLLGSAGDVWMALGAAPWFGSTEPLDDAAPGECDAALVADLDNDGALDVVCQRGGNARASRNSTAELGNYSTVTLLAEQVKDSQATASGRVNAYGIGSTLEMRAGDRIISRVVDEQVTHFGLAQFEKPDALRIVWTNGIPSQIVKPAVNSYICEVQSLKGSCPYLYGWDGEKFVFVTDLLWAAPIGLQFADGVQAVPREWEHLFVPGDLVQTRNGVYELRVTEELWEAAYFDQIELTAVDHPVGTELVTNEKVGPGSIAEPRLYVFDNGLPPTSAKAVYVDGSSTDFTETFRAADEHYATGHRAKYRQGLVEKHAIELEFSDIAESDRGQPLTLVLTGWVRPTDTSINVGLTYDPRYDSPMPPRLLVPDADSNRPDADSNRPDADSNWRTVKPFMGFPGGKTKTIAIDVSDDIDVSDPRLRIETSMEFFWDRAALVVGSAEGPVSTQVCDLTSATLRHRGLSARIPESGGRPEIYDYQTLDAGRDWPPMAGRFTRLGAVDQLLRRADDRLVVIGSGDEIALTFQTLPPVRDGWVRDFVLKSVGWDKDADLNTLFGDSSEPYPTLGVTNYPDLHEFDRRADAEYQTRRQINVP